MFKVVVAGGREFNDYELVKEKLLQLLVKYNFKDVEIVSGGARGADSLGEKFAKELGCNLKKFPAEWDKWGEISRV